ncbi:F-type H+-transporting ATPase subunit epsilon [Gelidibacter sediminis]|uniref:F-type H+-transporting ATPase subunit epsilon n=1 Tax=Gelidibacter sediminis TaxID=1608710 RepID=A0A4R7Q815_9FLAO|nr:F0F1 ATP synthase subunit epsilon [Gelidibacter sediminis]TDU43708.1 F-type H+-transporting ATPase subunit epsilon [Gelidibacter sediminis]
MYLEIVSPEASLVSGNVDSVTVPGIEGEFQMLNNHAAIVSILGKGKVKFKGNATIAAGQEKNFSQEDGQWVMHINSGTVEMKDNNVIVLVD